VLQPKWKQLSLLNRNKTISSRFFLHWDPSFYRFDIDFRITAIAIPFDINQKMKISPVLDSSDPFQAALEIACESSDISVASIGSVKHLTHATTLVRGDRSKLWRLLSDNAFEEALFFAQSTPILNIRYGKCNTDTI
jgi:hypothetical protein